LPRAVLDPGVLVAAAISPKGVCRQLLDRILDEKCALVVCPQLIGELQEVLLRPKFRRYLSVDQALAFVRLTAGVAEAHPDPTTHPGVSDDPDDDYLVALAQAVDADFLVSGDPHLTGLSTMEPPVLTPRALLEWLER
jgi:putative PIN family toxin of toxin-antitoxin system